LPQKIYCLALSGIVNQPKDASFIRASIDNKEAYNCDQRRGGGEVRDRRLRPRSQSAVKDAWRGLMRAICIFVAASSNLAPAAALGGALAGSGGGVLAPSAGMADDAALGDAIMSGGGSLGAPPPQMSPALTQPNGHAGTPPPVGPSPQGVQVASNDPSFMPSFTAPPSGNGQQATVGGLDLDAALAADAQPAPGAAPQQGAPASGNVLDGLLANIAHQESDGSGGYLAIGLDTGGGNRAIGKYQVMASNVGPWTQEVLGQAMTPEQFRASPQAQEMVARAKLGQYLQRTGSPADAASMWFTGRPAGVAGQNATDGGMTNAQYMAGATSREPCRGLWRRSAQTPAPPRPAGRRPSRTASPVGRARA
jgi:hypothetical protein